ncbi:hypothetical protein L1987_67440 [Smallanthus sonchifolius]|uniref:Uncharacterized protein n=1 Tax=Smallanthus sonchifolius TaxID=185202 RepID=A0ACB9B347_9ASTR|nr:hypothetical protein L1987_67440 [Smallanthus sonchifolius]
MLDQSQMMNRSQLISLSNQMNNRGGGYYYPPLQVDHIMLKNQNTKPRNNKNWKVKKGNNNNSSNGSNLGYYYPPTLKELQQQNRLKARRYISKKKFNHPFAPRNTTSFLIRAKKSGGITSLVSPCPVTPAVLPTPIFSPSREVLVDMAKEEWGVDGYGSMKGLIRLRSPNNDGGSSESDVEVESRLDHDLSRFEMVNPINGGGSDHITYQLENRMDDQDAHIARLEEENLVLNKRLFLMEREFGKLRTRVQLLEMGRRGRGFVEEVVENDSENENASGSRGCCRSVEEGNDSVDNRGSDNGEKDLQQGLEDGW